VLRVLVVSALVALTCALVCTRSAQRALLVHKCALGVSAHVHTPGVHGISTSCTNPTYTYVHVCAWLREAISAPVAARKGPLRKVYKLLPPTGVEVMTTQPNLNCASPVPEGAGEGQQDERPGREPVCATCGTSHHAKQHALLGPGYEPDPNEAYASICVCENQETGEAFAVLQWQTRHCVETYGLPTVVGAFDLRFLSASEIMDGLKALGVQNDSIVHVRDGHRRDWMDGVSLFAHVCLHSHLYRPVTDDV
jgi:hypothetical protein